MFHKNVVKRPDSPVAHPDARTAQKAATLALADGRAQPRFGDSPLLTIRCGSVLLGLRRGVQRRPPRNLPRRHSSPGETGHCYATRASRTWWCRCRPPETWPMAEEAKQAASSVGVHRYGVAALAMKQRGRALVQLVCTGHVASVSREVCKALGVLLHSPVVIGGAPVSSPMMASREVCKAPGELLALTGHNNWWCTGLFTGDGTQRRGCKLGARGFTCTGHDRCSPVRNTSYAV
jgi:hypothetical protein